MRMLFTSTSGLGHLLPLLPLARAARSAGHEVVIGTGSALASHVEGAGFRHVELRGDIQAARAHLPPIDHLPRASAARRPGG